MRSTSLPRIITSVAVVTALSLGAVACGSDDKSADTTSALSAATSAVPANDQASSSPEPTGSTTVSNGGGSNGATSGDLNDYIESLASTTDNFDDLTSTPEETRCAAAAILTPIGVEVLQQQGISVEDINDDLDLTENISAEAAVGIADGLVECGLAIRFTASLAEGEATEDLDDAQEAALFECVSAAIDEETARKALVGFLTPDAGQGANADRYAAGVLLSGLVRDCGVEATVYP